MKDQVEIPYFLLFDLLAFSIIDVLLFAKEKYLHWWNISQAVMSDILLLIIFLKQFICLESFQLKDIKNLRDTWRDGLLIFPDFVKQKWETDGNDYCFEYLIDWVKIFQCKGAIVFIIKLFRFWLTTVLHLPFTCFNSKSGKQRVTGHHNKKQWSRSVL